MDEECLHRYPKRQRLGREWKSLEHHFKSPVVDRKPKIFDISPNILHSILQWLPSAFLESNLKLVSKYFRACVNDFIFMKFNGLHLRMARFYHKYIDIFDSSQDVNIKRYMFQIIATIEIMIYQYKILEASIWRYIRSEFIFCVCFGKILDIFDNMFFKLHHTKEVVRSPRTQKLVKKLVGSVKAFILHFERYTEMKLNENCFVSGAKICDIFDSCILSTREVLYENYDNGMCHLKVRYELPNAWFNVISYEGYRRKPYKPPSWQEQQRLMYLRLRRLVSTHTAHQMYFQHSQIAQKFLILGGPNLYHITSSVYCGHGETEDKVFFYGNFNTGGYMCKVKRMEHRDVSPEERHPYHLQVTIDLTCPLEQAPLAVYKQFCMRIDYKNARPVLKRRSTRQQKAFNMRIEFNSECDKPLLPSKYVFEVSEEKRLEMVQERAKS